MATKIGDENLVRLPNGNARIEWIANFDEIRRFWAAGYSAAALYRKLFTEGKLTMNERTFQGLVRRHLKLKEDRNIPEIVPPLPQKIPPRLPGTSREGNGGAIQMKKDKSHRQSRYSKEG